MSSGNDKEVRIGIAAETSGADEAKRALEGVKRAAEEAAQASGEVKPMAGGGEGDAEGAKRSVEEMTAAVSEQAEANGILIDSLDELTDAEAGVVRSTGKVSEEFKKLSEEGKKPDGFAKLFSPERMDGIKGSFRELGQAVGDFAKEFSQTEEGQKLLEGLSDETKVFGETALSVAGAAAKGFSEGGPIGGAVSGLTALVKHVADEYLEAQRRIEASNQELAQANEDHIQRMQEKARAAAEAGIAERTEDENERLKDQNDILKENADLMRSRRDLVDSEFELKQAKERAAGKPGEVLEAEKIQHDLQRKEAETKQAEQQRLEERNVIWRRGNDARQEAANIEKTPGFGNQSEKYKEQIAIAEKAEQELENRKRTDAGLDDQGRNQLKADRNRGEARLIGLKDRFDKRQASESLQKQKNDKRRSEESTRQRQAREHEAAKGEVGRRRAGLNESAMNDAGKFSGAADFLKSKGKAPELAKMLGGAGKDLSNGADEKEIAQIAKQFAEVTKGMNGPVLDSLKKMLDAQMKQAEEIRKLQANLKNGVNAKH